MDDEEYRCDESQECQGHSYVVCPVSLLEWFATIEPVGVSEGDEHNNSKSEEQNQILPEAEKTLNFGSSIYHCAVVHETKRWQYQRGSSDWGVIYGSALERGYVECDPIDRGLFRRRCRWYIEREIVEASIAVEVWSHEEVHCDEEYSCTREPKTFEIMFDGPNRTDVDDQGHQNEITDNVVVVCWDATYSEELRYDQQRETSDALCIAEADEKSIKKWSPFVFFTKFKTSVNTFFPIYDRLTFYYLGGNRIRQLVQLEHRRWRW
jgi:hypothetical protein